MNWEAPHRLGKYEGSGEEGDDHDWFEIPRLCETPILATEVYTRSEGEMSHIYPPFTRPTNTESARNRGRWGREALEGKSLTKA